MWARRCAELAALLAGVLAGGAAFAQQPGWSVDQLMRALAQRDHAQAQFTETKTMHLLSRPLTLRGTLSYRAPDWLEKRTLDPNEEILLVDGERITVEIPGRRIHRSFTMQELPVVWGFVESIRATLRGDLAALARHYRVEVEGTPARWSLVLLPSDPGMAEFVTVIRIAGAHGRLTGMEVVETAGDRVVTQFAEAAR
jgi:outer membrane lipoprotein-sorting protein